MKCIQLIFSSSKMLEFGYGAYKSFSFNSPREIEEPMGLGTYVSKHIKDSDGNDISYRIYHCRKVNGKVVWYKLPSIRVTDGVISADSSSIDALNEVFDELPNELKNLLNKLNNYMIK